MSFAEDNAKAWQEIKELHDSRPAEFGSIETANGPGSTMAQTEGLRGVLPIVFARHGVKTVLDVGCGDWNWMQHVDLSGLASYTGWDVEPSTVAANAERFIRPNVTFIEQSVLTADALPQVDLIMTRHVLIHFPNAEITAVLDKMRACGAKYLLTSHWPDGVNDDYEPEGLGWRGYMERALNMEAAPFNLPKVEAIAEPAASAGVLATEHELALFELIPAPGVQFDEDWRDSEFTVGDDAELVPNLPPGIAVVTPAQYIEQTSQRRQAEGASTYTGCEHPTTYRVHRADDTIATVCATCQAELGSKNEPGGAFSFHDTIARWAADAQSGGLGASDKAARIQGRPATRKELLKGLKDNHRDVMNMVRDDTSLEAAWLLLGAQAAVIDAILDELLGGGGG